jgi:guanine deaminase
MRDQYWLSRAVELAVDNVGSGGGPFGAMIVRGNEALSTGVNRVTRDNDPTAHAEVVAIRAACTAIEDFSLAGCVLFTSCEPCPLCLSSALWARVDRVVYAADRDDAARGGFDDREFHELFGKERDEWPTPIESLRLLSSVAPFDAWMRNPERTAY